MEMNSPFDQAEGRSWGKVFVVLKGTMLSIHRVKNPGFFGKLDHDYKGTPDRPLGTTAGSLIRSYTLQNAEVGIAVDYQKRDFVPRAVFLRLVGQGTAAERELFQKTKPFVIRVRVEADQFLLSCSMVQTFLYWLECLNAAIDLAPPLDERCLPRQRTIPIRRRRRTQVQTGTGTDRSTEQVRRLLWGGPPSTPARNRPDRETNEVGLAVSGRANGEPDVQRPSSSMQVVVSGLRDVFRSQSPGEKSPEKSKWRWSIGSIASVSTRAAGVKRAVLRESNSIASLRAGVTRAVLRESNSIASLRAGVTRAVIREQNSIASLRAGMTAAVLREQSSIASLRAGMTGALLREQNSIASLRAVVEMGWPTPRWGRSAAQQMVDAYDGVPEMPAHRLTAANHMALQNSNGEGRLVRPSSSEGKWCPSHNWTYARHVRYARRCMTNLWSNAPRQSDIIVKDGKRWKIRWDLGELVLYDPEKLPGYDDAEERGEAVEGPEPRALLCF
ncbi:MAG: hypothetical protein M1832_002203 [Thelocarpon impressellum]|nr:MAG: hypothetical protein M1832_002203 [Thelocarpon impressellum]